MNEQTAIVAVDQRALQAFGIDDLPVAVTALKALAAKSADITTITNQAGYGQIHRFEMVLKGERVNLTKRGKAARDETNAFNKKVIEIEKTLLSAFTDEEERLAALKGEWDAARERERQAEIDAENARVTRIQTAIDEIRFLPQEAMGKTAAHALSVLAEAEAMVLTEAEYQEGLQTAQTALHTSIVAIKGIVAERQAAEAEQARVTAERAELAKFRAEVDERERIQRIRVAQELHEARVETERLLKAGRDAQDAADKQAAELERQRKEADAARLAEDQRVTALQEAEQKRLDTIRAELEQQRLEDEQVETARRLAILNKPPSAIEMVTIPKAEYEQLLEDSALLNKLLAGGVDNWEGYDEARA